MRNTFLTIPLSLLGTLLVLSGCVAVDQARNDRIFADFFSATPANGYTVERALVGSDTDTEASILRQAVAYHQAKDYDYAIMALRAYREEAAQVSPEVSLLSATAAIASGYYEEGAAYLSEVGPDDGHAFAEASWYAALLAVRSDRLRAAQAHLDRVTAFGGQERFAVLDLQARITTK